MSDTVSIIITTYNNVDKVGICLKSCLEQTHESLKIIVVDDGSTDDSPAFLQDMKLKHSNLYIILKEHGERGIAREEGINMAKALKSDFILFIDDDMILDPRLVEKSLGLIHSTKHPGALVIPEIPFSHYSNYFSRVKVFERSVINRAGETLGKNSIEAARFWGVNAYKESGELDPGQTAFEETQPTIRYKDRGGLILRATNTWLLHDEKMVTLSNILKKKYNYFKNMKTTLDHEEKGFIKALQRWYLFRPVLYRKENLKQYLLHPLLTLGMIIMYMGLSIIAVAAHFQSRPTQEQRP